MTTPRLSLLLVVGMAVAVVAARGRRDDTAVKPAVHIYDVTGTVTAAPSGGQVTIAHEDIAGYMPAMTMPFTLAPDQPAPKVGPGDRVRFQLMVGAAGSHAGAFAVTGHDAAVAAAATAPPPRSGRLRPGDRLPEIGLVDQAGAPFTADRLRGRRSALTFIFTRCPVPEFCPLMVQRFAEIEAAARRDPRLRDIQLVAVTLDPAFDTPSILDAYARAKQLDPARWRLVTGPPEAVALLTRAFAVHVERNGVLLDHTLATAVIDADGRIVELWRGNGWRAAEVLEALRRTPEPTE